MSSERDELPLYEFELLKALMTLLGKPVFLGDGSYRFVIDEQHGIKRRGLGIVHIGPPPKDGGSPSIGVARDVDDPRMVQVDQIIGTWRARQVKW